MSFQVLCHLTGALWARISKNTDRSTGPLACPFTCSLAPLTHFARALRYAHLFARSLTSLTRSLRSLPRLWESELLMSQNDLVLSHSGVVRSWKALPEKVKEARSVNSFKTALDKWMTEKTTGNQTTKIGRDIRDTMKNSETLLSSKKRKKKTKRKKSPIGQQCVLHLIAIVA